MALGLIQKRKSKQIAYPLPLPPENLFTKGQLKWLEEFRRAIEANFQALFTGTLDEDALIEKVLYKANPFYAIVTGSNAKGAGWYDCTLTSFYDDGDEVTEETGVVLNLVDIIKEPDTAGLSAGEGLICWRMSMSQPDVSPVYYIGIELYGRGVIGICS